MLQQITNNILQYIESTCQNGGWEEKEDGYCGPNTIWRDATTPLFEGRWERESFWGATGAKGIAPSLPI